MHLEQTVHIDRPAADVFDFLLDLGNHPRVAGGITAVRGVEDGPLALGRRYSQTSTVLGQTVEVTVEVISYERGRELGLKTARACCRSHARSAWIRRARVDGPGDVGWRQATRACS
jgi:uncharacterized membrane protein